MDMEESVHMDAVLRQDVEPKKNALNAWKQELAWLRLNLCQRGLSS